jgi:hypothetical protein
MTDTNGNTTYLEFLEKDQPLFDGGNYEIKVEHSLSAAPGMVGTSTYSFTVAAPRFALNPQDVVAVFPPPGSLGDHSNVLPHIQFQRSTLPWELAPGDGDGPWLALLVFYDGETDPPQSCTVGDLQKTISGDNHLWWTGLTVDTNTGDPVSIIEVDAALLKAIFPAPATRKLLAHVRNNTNTPNTPSGKERAVIIANRLPMDKGNTTVHLVSLEGQDVNTTVSTKAATGDRVRLISLYSWRFTCTSPELSFSGLLQGLNRSFLFELNLASSDVLALDNNSIPQVFANELTKLNIDSAGAQISTVEEERRWLIRADIHQLDLRLEPSPVKQDPNSFVLMQGQKRWVGLSLTTDDIQSLNKSTLTDNLKKIIQHTARITATSVSPVKNNCHWIIWCGRNRLDLSLMPPGGHLKVMEKQPGVLRLPRSKNADAEYYFKRGSRGLPHRTRYGNRTVSWYHGPLIPIVRTPTAPPSQIDFPIQSDEVGLQYDDAIDMWDVSYAAAWDLGRLLTLQNGPIAAAIYDWKRQHAQAKKLQDAEQLLMHLPLGRVAAPDDPPPNVIAWFKDLAHLRGVPFRYLVPDERMLPPESLRFFQIDPQWVACLLDGAFSVGRVLVGDGTSSKPFHPVSWNIESLQGGFLLRSAIVSGWPDLLTDSVAWDMKPATKAREEKLSTNVLLCLFKELIWSVDFHLKPEALHFGLEVSNGMVQRTLRNKNGDLDTSTISASFLLGNKRVVGVVDWQALKTQLELKLPGLGFSQVSSAIFAFQMIEEVKRVQFTWD